MQGKEENLICLSVMLTARDRALIVSTQETHMPTSSNHAECINYLSPIIFPLKNIKNVHHVFKVELWYSLKAVIFDRIVKND